MVDIEAVLRDSLQAVSSEAFVPHRGDPELLWVRVTSVLDYVHRASRGAHEVQVDQAVSRIGGRRVEHIYLNQLPRRVVHKLFGVWAPDNLDYYEFPKAMFGR